MSDFSNIMRATANKMMNPDGSVTDMFGNVPENTSEIWRSKRAIPNKFLNPDGTYTTFQQILKDGIDTDIYVIVDELPEEGNPQKIYLVPSGNVINEYRWTGNNWDPIGMLQFNIEDYSTTEQMNTAISNAVQSSKNYTDQQIGNALIDNY